MKIPESKQLTAKKVENRDIHKRVALGAAAWIVLKIDL
jgi:hypothetical protein